MAFRPKEVLRAAREYEASGKFAEAATAYSQVGSFLLRRGDLAKAASLFEKAIALYPSGSRPYVYLAVCAMELEKNGEAEKHMEALARLGVHKGRALPYGELVQAKLGKYPRLAEVFYQTVLSLDRTRAAPFLAYAKWLLTQGKTVRARRVVLEAFQTRTQDEEVLVVLRLVLSADESPDAPESLSYLSRFEAGKVSRDELLALLSAESEETGVSVHAVVASASGLAKEMVADRSLTEMIRDLERELGGESGALGSGTGALIQEFRRRAEPVLKKSTKSRCDIAMAFFEMGLVEEASAELNQIAEGDPLYWEAQVLLAEIFAAEGSYLSAVEVLQKCLRSDAPGEAVRTEVRYKLVQVLLRLEDNAAASEQLKLLEKEAPDYRDLRGLRAQLQDREKKELGISSRWMRERKKAS